MKKPHCMKKPQCMKNVKPSIRLGLHNSKDDIIVMYIPKWRPGNGMFMGIELEVEFCKTTNLSRVISALYERFNPFIVLKRELSTKYGFEIVTVYLNSAKYNKIV